MIKAIMFDFGNTLAVMSPSREELFIDAVNSVGLAINKSAVEEAYRIVDFNRKFSSLENTKYNEKNKFYRNYNEELCVVLGVSNYFEKIYPKLKLLFSKKKRWVLIDDAKFVLRNLKQKQILLALIANWDKNLKILVNKLGIDNYFSTVIASQDIGIEKPDKLIFWKVLEDLSIKSNHKDVLFIGDDYRLDVLGARSAGLVPILIDRNNYYPFADCMRFKSLTEWYKETFF